MNTNTSIKPRRLTTTELAYLQPRCVSPCEGAWELDTVFENQWMRERLNRQLRATEEERVKAHKLQRARQDLRANIFRLKEGGPTKILDEESARLTQKYDDIELRLYEDAADGMWLPHWEIAVVELTGKPVLCAFGGQRCLVVGFNDSCIGTIINAFGSRGVEPPDITVHAFFGRPRMPGDYYAHIETSCREMRMGSQCLLRLEKDARYGYAEHPTLHDPNLGIFMRLA